jgi:hypothetical protein
VVITQDYHCIPALLRQKRKKAKKALLKLIGQHQRKTNAEELQPEAWDYAVQQEPTGLLLQARLIALCHLCSGKRKEAREETLTKEDNREKSS